MKQAWEERQHKSAETLLDAIRVSAVLRTRPKAMTVAVILAGLLPIRFGGSTGSEVINRIAAPMIRGTGSVPLLSMFVVPAAYLLMGRRVAVCTGPSRRKARLALP